MNKGRELQGNWRATRAAVLAALAIGGAGVASGCLDRPLEPQTPKTTTTIVERLTQSSVDKIDILLAIDNSRSMADKQQVLQDAVPDLVEGLVNPICVDPETNAPLGETPPDPTVPCPGQGAVREFDPIIDIHIGVITSSLGGHGSNSCADSTTEETCGGSSHTTNNDKGHLISRGDACTGNAVEGLYNQKDFLNWDPSLKKSDPPGTADKAALIQSLADLVAGTGQIGCGYEAQLESIYRFLADPNPYATIGIADDVISKEGTDDALLTQRKDFLRANSLLAVIMLTDENDCSIREYSSFYLAAQTDNGYHLPPARAVCADDPGNKCCASCGQGTPAGCEEDPTCSDPGNKLDNTTDPPNLRCFNQKRRFGLDFLYPVERYINMFKNASIGENADLSGDQQVPNPIYSDLSSSNSSIRDPGLVFFAGIVGVPWQLIARDPADLGKGFKNSDEMADVWPAILGDPSAFVDPTDTHMIESVTPRDGLPMTVGDPIHGGEWTVTKSDDLQYACIFELADPRDCAVIKDCDCTEIDNDNPLCEGATKQTQVRAKAYPGLRQLEVLQGIGPQGIVASVCPKQLDAPGAADYGYRPSIKAIIERLKTALGGQCLPRRLNTDPKTGQVGCLVLEGTVSAEGCTPCDQQPAGRIPVSELHEPAAQAAGQDPIYENIAKGSEVCFCEIKQFDSTEDPDDNDDLKACQTDLTEPVNSDVSNGDLSGWCYIDGEAGIGDKELVSKCPDTEKRIVRFTGEAEAQAGATLFITCNGEQQ
jgi:hypothetical protein